MVDRLATIDMGRKWGLRCPFRGWGRRRAGSSHNVAWAEAYLLTKWHLDPPNRLATIDMGADYTDAWAKPVPVNCESGEILYPFPWVSWVPI